MKPFSSWLSESLQRRVVAGQLAESLPRFCELCAELLGWFARSALIPRVPAQENLVSLNVAVESSQSVPS